MKVLVFVKKAMASAIQFAGKKRCSPFPRSVQPFTPSGTWWGTESRQQRQSSGSSSHLGVEQQGSSSCLWCIGRFHSSWHERRFRPLVEWCDSNDGLVIGSWFPVTDHPTEREEKEYEKQRVELLLSLLDALLSDSEHISYHHRNLFSAPLKDLVLKNFSSPGGSKN